MDDRRNHPHCGSPLVVMLLLNAHFNPEPLGNGSPADKGKFHVKALCRLPLP